jgi:hypothetical protein
MVFILIIKILTTCYMKDMIKNMLAIGATIGLSDREAFVNKVSGLISDYEHDPAKADKWASGIAQTLENFKNDYRIERVIGNAMSEKMPDKKDITALTEAIQELTQILQDKKGDTNV